MRHITVRLIGHSLYFRIPREWVRANNLKNNDLAFLKPIEGRPDKFEVTLVKMPVPPELVPQGALDAGE
jgi:hypothetical protein